MMLAGCSDRAENAQDSAAAAAKTHTEPTTGMQFLFIKGDSFDMGDTFNDGFAGEVPVHKVTVSDYYIGVTEVTQAQWEKVMGYNPSMFIGPDHPVDRVSWAEIREFVRRLNEINPGAGYRLPTEAEWEFAARERGKKIRWAGTNKEEEVGDYAWYLHNADQTSHPVATKKPNALGLYDMSGNLWEWVYDKYGVFTPEEQIDPIGPDTGKYQDFGEDFRTYKGAAWDYIPRLLRVTQRSGNHPFYKRQWIGFRLAKDADPVNKPFKTPKYELNIDNPEFKPSAGAEVDKLEVSPQPPAAAPTPSPSAAGASTERKPKHD